MTQPDQFPQKLLFDDDIKTLKGVAYALDLDDEEWVEEIKQSLVCVEDKPDSTSNKDISTAGLITVLKVKLNFLVKVSFSLQNLFSLIHLQMYI